MSQYFFTHFCPKLVELSRSDDLFVALEEWTYHSEIVVACLCLCAHPIKYCTRFSNRYTGEIINIGCECLKNFGWAKNGDRIVTLSRPTFTRRDYEVYYTHLHSTSGIKRRRITEDLDLDENGYELDGFVVADDEVEYESEVDENKYDSEAEEADSDEEEDEDEVDIEDTFEVKDVISLNRRDCKAYVSWKNSSVNKETFGRFRGDVDTYVKTGNVYHVSWKNTWVELTCDLEKIFNKGYKL